MNPARRLSLSSIVGTVGIVLAAALAGAALLIPLLPIAIVVAGAWLLWRLVHRGSSPAHEVVRP